MPLPGSEHRRSLRSFFRGFFGYYFGKKGQRKVTSLRLYYRFKTDLLLHSGSAMESITSMWAARVWVDQEAFPRIKKLLLRAERTIAIQMFIWKDDKLGREMAETVTQAADKGVQVDITKESLGDIFELERDFFTTKDSKDPVWQKFWSHPRIRVSHAHHNDHAKVYIIDGEILLLTGMNIANEYHESWHDYLVELRGSHFVDEYLTHGEKRFRNSPIRLAMNIGEQHEIRPVLTELLESANESILVEHCYVSDPHSLDILIKKSHQGVRVTLVIPDRSNHGHYSNMQFIARLITEGARENVEVFLYPGMFHGKTILVDRTRAFLGSANLIKSSIDEMGEVNVLMSGFGQRAVLRLRDALRGDILKSRPITTPPHFSWLGKWLAWMKL
jgi:cardiolipin synthase